MTIKLQLPKLMHLRPRITVVGVGGAGSNAVNNMITSGLTGVNFVVANTDSQSLANSAADHRIQLGAALTEGLGAGARPEVGRAAAEEAIEEIRAQFAGSHMVFVAAGMGGGTGTGAAAVIARVARECGALTVGVVTKPFHFEGTRRMRAAEAGIQVLRPEVDTLIVIPNQNLFRIANERTTFAEAFVLADQVLYSGIACVVDLIVKEGLINLDFADVRTIMSGMGTAMMGTGEASGEKRAVIAAEEAISNPLLDDISLRGAKGLLLSITGSRDLKLYEVDEAAQRVRQEVDGEANIIVGATFDDTLGDRIRVSIVASGMERLNQLEAAEAVSNAYAMSHAHAAPPAPAPTPAELQPPFIEPYPEPIAPEPSVAVSVHQPPEQLPAMEAGAPHSPPDFARALSAALEPPPVEQFTPSKPNLAEAMPASVSQGPASSSPAVAAPSYQGQSQPTGWSSETGAVFHEAPPPVGQDGRRYGDDQYERAPQGQGGFYPQPPGDPQRQRRLPEVQDFPLVGQREYLAKSAQYSDQQPNHVPAPRSYVQPAPPAAKPAKVGFFGRLFGRKPRPEQASPSPPGYPQASEGMVASRPDSRQADQTARLSEMRRPRRSGEEEYELPAFFGGDRK